MGKKGSLVTDGFNAWKYLMHTNDKDIPFKKASTVELAVKLFLDLQAVGECIMVEPQILNPFLRVLETLQNTDYIILPIKKSMMCNEYNSKESYYYLIFRISNNERFEVDEIKIKTK